MDNQKFAMLTFNMYLNLNSSIIQENYNFDNPNYPPNYAFTPKNPTTINLMASYISFKGIS